MEEQGRLKVGRFEIKGRLRLNQQIARRKLFCENAMKTAPASIKAGGAEAAVRMIPTFLSAAMILARNKRYDEARAAANAQLFQGLPREPQAFTGRVNNGLIRCSARLPLPIYGPPTRAPVDSILWWFGCRSSKTSSTAKTCQ
jgi:hypothetical protein